jgi:serine/alanine adding enzyme
MIIVRQLDQDRWKAFVDENPYGNIFHTPEMFEVFARTKGHRPELWAAVAESRDHLGRGEVLALLPIVKISLLNGPLRRLTTRAIAYGGVLCAPSEEGRAAMKLLLETYKRDVGEGALFTEFRNMSDMTEIQPVLQASGFAYEDHLNFIVDLTQPRDTVWNHISKSGQQRIRTSRNKGTMIEEITDSSKLDIAYRFLQDVYARVQVPLADISLFQAALDILAPRGMFKGLLARAGEPYAATALLLSYHGRILYWYVGADRSLSSYGPSELLVWHALQWGQEHKFEMFDFGGGGKPDQKYGPREFKEKFGGTKVNYGRHSLVHSPMRLKLSQVGYQVYRRGLVQFGGNP